MIGRDRRYGRSRNASLKARLGIATAVLVGGGAIGVAAVAATSHSAPTAAKSSSFSEHRSHTQTLGSYWVNAGWSTTTTWSHGRMHRHHTWHKGHWAQYTTGSLLSTALSNFSWSQNNAFNLLSRLSNRDTQATFHHTTFAKQAGIVVLATHRFLIVQSADGALRLWLLSGGTRFQNVSSTWNGTNAMTGGNTFVTNQTMNTNNMAPITTLLAGTMGTAQRLTTPVAKPVTVSVQVAGTGVTVTVTVTTTTATVTQATPSSTTTSFQNPFATMQRVARGDLVLVAGVRTHGFLHAQIVLFSQTTTTTNPTPSPSASVSTTPSVMPTPSPSSSLQSGTHT
jgi:hypothetical protein